MLRWNCPCEACSNQLRCGLLDAGCGLPEGPELRINVEEFCSDAQIPATAGCLLAVKSGAVKTICHDAYGHARVIDFSFPGDMIGLETLADAGDSGVVYRASVSMTTVCRVSINPAAAKRASSHFCQRLSAELATRIRANFHHRKIVADSAQVRLAHYLMLLLRARQEQRDLQGVILPNIARADIASYLHLRAETLSRTLSIFRTNGWVRGPMHRLEVIDVDALAALTRSPDTAKSARGRSRSIDKMQDPHG